MKKIKFLKVRFDTQIKAYEVPAFRGAMIAKVGKENDWFHNHLDDSKFLYRYPLIQYKRIGENPVLLCIDEGVEEIHKFFEKRNWDLVINEQTHQMTIQKLDMNQFTMMVGDKSFRYNIYNWIALSQENYKKYNALTGMGEKINFLENILTGNILSFAKGIDWEIDREIEVKILDWQEPVLIRMKAQKVMAFRLDFETNVFLPNWIGLGKQASIGFGVVKQVKE